MTVSNIEIQLLPIRTPNYILTGNKSLKFHVSQLSEEVIGLLCDEFRNNLMEKRKKCKPLNNSVR